MYILGTQKNKIFQIYQIYHFKSRLNGQEFVSFHTL